MGNHALELTSALGMSILSGNFFSWHFEMYRSLWCLEDIRGSGALLGFMRVLGYEQIGGRPAGSARYFVRTVNESTR